MSVTTTYLQFFTGIVVNGVRVLNRDGIPSPSAVYNLLGVQIRYISVPETIQILGKLQQEIIVEVSLKYCFVINAYISTIYPQIYVNGG
jgi:hypothetical protein